MALYTIYGLIDPTNGELFYIGQTIYNRWARLTCHMTTSKVAKSPVYGRIKEIVAKGCRPKTVQLKRFESDLCLATDKNFGLYFERVYIQEYSALGTLLNIKENPLYDRKTKTFLQPINKKELKCNNGIYFIDSDVIYELHKPLYDPFKNHRFLAKLQQP